MTAAVISMLSLLLLLAFVLIINLNLHVGRIEDLLIRAASDLHTSGSVSDATGVKIISKAREIVE